MAKNEITRLMQAFIYSWQGLAAAWRNEAAFRTEVVLAPLVIPLGVWLGDNGAERALLAGVWIVVMMAELLNSAVEAVVNRFGEERHPLAGLAKDLGSAAVLVALALVGLVWAAILWPRL